MFTIVETPTFTDEANAIWSAQERDQFYAWLAVNPEAGKVIPGSGGCRKVRWIGGTSGKRGGVRVIYFNRLRHGEIWLLLIYAKRNQSNIPAHILKAIREELNRE
ncbi:transcriptional regulator [Parahaliea maris]|uniref:Transcriptional regulator n=1 Tax=Parahaliea maris TaxID=2716870 RepID=A0A5C9A7U3_9GAMM|nr:transcriptional regulator [Parahaliea maris]TXS96818.1 transcriptional regulator [Parahaliea maris]